eukprot:1812268-Prymnesium_polylepis.1
MSSSPAAAPRSETRVPLPSPSRPLPHSGRPGRQLPHLCWLGLCGRGAALPRRGPRKPPVGRGHVGIRPPVWAALLRAAVPDTAAHVPPGGRGACRQRALPRA